jgi:hypothetical protein
MTARCAFGQTLQKITIFPGTAFMGCALLIGPLPCLSSFSAFLVQKIRSIEKDGPRIYGLAVSAQKSALLELSECPAVS